ncbi:hypothetical protein IVG45_20645 [Methylomonas sp. LL1]|uniref:hypothetical protein n=1 Tax=Methylomonas sp. LL1 TaxID=2785785 RepID=UPI0018C3B9B6|nr:hypothetical protein [Methylomonas sp. LL1]QPK63185.1 hypothetical protein IVG45_20645 [Methylomonas sp. LL1]
MSSVVDEALISRVLLVEDEPAAAKQHLQANQLYAVLLDLPLPDCFGLNVVEVCRQHTVPLPMTVLAKGAQVCHVTGQSSTADFGDNIRMS